MSTSVEPITVYGKEGPNPPKVAIIAEELGIPYTINPIPISEVKTPSYVAINPNGRLPSIHDPNTNITLWETGAIIEYLIEHYDTSHLLSFPQGTPESYHAKQWLYFQTSGQGPYYGQVAYFKKFHTEQVPSVIDRFVKEANRVSGVLEEGLSRQKKEYPDGDAPWLVGNKLSYADIVFIPWQKIILMLCDKEEYDEDNYPLLKGWIGKMDARKAVKDILAEAFKGVQA